MKIITISGKAGHGKDFTANAIKDILEANGKKVLITHYADLLKFICRSMFGWNGEKDEEGRRLLQYVGTDVVRKKNPDFWVDYMVTVLKLFEDEWEYVIIPDAQFPNEIDNLKKQNAKSGLLSIIDLDRFDVTSIRVIRPNYDNKLTSDAKQHISEHALDDYKFDYTLFNSGKGDYVDNINYICKELFDKEEVNKNDAGDN